MKDVITGPGMYRLRCGGLAEAVYFRDGRWFGHICGCDRKAFLATSWSPEGRSRIYGTGEGPHDTIGPEGTEMLVMNGGEFPAAIGGAA